MEEALWDTLLLFASASAKLDEAIRPHPISKVDGGGGGWYRARELTPRGMTLRGMTPCLSLGDGVAQGGLDGLRGDGGVAHDAQRRLLIQLRAPLRVPVIVQWRSELDDTSV